MLHDRSLRKGRARSPPTERDRVRTHVMFRKNKDGGEIKGQWI